MTRAISIVQISSPILRAPSGVDALDDGSGEGLGVGLEDGLGEGLGVGLGDELGLGLGVGLGDGVGDVPATFNRNNILLSRSKSAPHNIRPSLPLQV